MLSPSAGLPAVFPDVYERGLQCLRSEFGLEPVEYPSTRAAAASPAERAADIMAAFGDPTISAILATIGGDDQIKVLRHLDPAVVAANPKPFFGYSDNTNLLNFLWYAGVVGFHGGSVMVHLARPGGMHPLTAASFRAALFTSGDYELTAPDEFGDETLDWADTANLDRDPPMRPASPWTWHNADQVAQGPTWGGNLEILSWLLAADRFIAPPQDYDGAILFIETSEEMPPALEVYRILRNIGERGILSRFAAILIGRAKAWNFDRQLDLAARAEYADQQRAAVHKALDEYNPSAMAVFDLDIGHTDPQLILPHGGTIRIDGPARRITVQY